MSARREGGQRAWWHDDVRRYFVAAAACAVFSVIYEFFSHGVFSPWMVGLGLIPLLAGLLPTLLYGALGGSALPRTRELWACGVMTLTVGSCLMGVLEIYGTTSPYVPWYFPAAVVLLGLAVLSQVLVGKQPSRQSAEA